MLREPFFRLLECRSHDDPRYRIYAIMQIRSKAAFTSGTSQQQVLVPLFARRFSKIGRECLRRQVSVMPSALL